MKSLKLLFISLIIILARQVSAYGQEESPKIPFKDRFFFGGNLGAQFGNLTFVDISPLIGYKITEKFHSGIGATYIYYKYKDIYGSYETSIYGGRVFSRYYFLESLFAHAEYEVLNLEVPEFSTSSGGTYSTLVRENITSVLVGAGYSQPIGQHSALVLMVLFNLTEEPYSPYQNPIIRIGFNAGF